MTHVRQLLEQFKAEFRGGQSPNPRAFLERVEGLQRSQLERAIERFLVAEPRRRYDKEALALSSARGVAENMERAMISQAGLWPSLLPRLRVRTQLRRAELIGRLASALEAEESARKVGAYYHGMEQGTLPADGVSDRVLQALGTIVGETADRLRAAGHAFDPVQGLGDAPASAFARTTAPTAKGAASKRDKAPEPATTPNHGEWDEVDRLFRGG
jgi:hypothetical protein